MERYLKNETTSKDLHEIVIKCSPERLKDTADPQFGYGIRRLYISEKLVL